MNYLNLKSMYKILELFEKKLHKYTFNCIKNSEFERIYIIEESLIILVEFQQNDFPVCTNVSDFFYEYIDHPILEFPVRKNIYYDFVVEELTPNEINFKFNNTAFRREVNSYFGITKDIGLDIYYIRFKGYNRLYWSPNTETTAERINRLIPNLQLKEKYNSWEGNLYNYIIFEVKDINNHTYYAVSYTKTSPKNYINKMGTNYINTGNFSNELDNALQSWKRKTRKQRLEEHLNYFVIQKYQKEFDDTWKYANYLLEKAKAGKFNTLERFSYIKPSNKWITEELVYRITKKLFKDSTVIYQHRPFYLKSSLGGQMSYDIFISKINIAIEYQGKQHFEPIDFFGGIIGFKNTKRRDAEKLQLSELHGVKLIYINYWEEVNEQLIRSKIEQALNN